VRATRVMASVSPISARAPAFDLPVLRRLTALVPIDLTVAMPIDRAATQSKRYPARTTLSGERQPAQPARTIMSGWAAHCRLLSDGRRQIVRLLLPGDILPATAPDNVPSDETVMALTEMVIAPAAALLASVDPQVVRALRIDAAMQRGYLYAQVTRLGRQSAIERTAGLLLELYDRLALVGATEGPDRFVMPLTQETLSDVLGLTTVHTNRTVQQLRRERLIETGRGRTRIVDRAALAQIADYRRTGGREAYRPIL